MSTNPESQPASLLPGRGVRIFLAGVAVVFLASAVMLFVLMNGKGKRGDAPVLTTPPDGSPVVLIDRPAGPADPRTPDHFASGFSIPPFNVVDQDEKPVSNDVFTGKITVIEFFFSNCPFICPAMNGVFGHLVNTLKDVPEAQFLSFSVDPLHDTPAALRDYAARLGADTTRWRFLTGKKDVIWNILSEGLLWGIEDRPEQPITLPSGSQMSNIRHPGWFALIGPDRKVLGIYKYDVPDDQQRLETRIRAIAAKMKN